MIVLMLLYARRFWMDGRPRYLCGLFLSLFFYKNKFIN